MHTQNIRVIQTYTKEKKQKSGGSGWSKSRLHWSMWGRVLLQQNYKISPNSITILDGGVLFLIVFFIQKPVYQFMLKHIYGWHRFSHFTGKDEWFGNHISYVNARFHLVATTNKFCFWEMKFIIHNVSEHCFEFCYEGENMFTVPK